MVDFLKDLFLGSDPPPPPNYNQIAKKDLQANIKLGDIQTRANRPKQITPFTTTTWRNEGTKEKPKWVQTVKLRPELRDTLDRQLQIGLGRTGAAKGMLNQIRDAYAQPVDYSQFRNITEVTDPNVNRQRAEDAAYRRATSRLDPRFEQEGERLDVQLRNQGLVPGDAAYDRAMGNFNRARNDAYAQAQDIAVGQGRAEANQLFNQMQSQQQQTAALREQDIMEALRRRSTPIREQNNLLAGYNIQPGIAGNAPGFTSAQGIANPGLMNAANLGYQGQINNFNVGEAQRQAALEGITNVATAAFGF